MNLKKILILLIIFLFAYIWKDYKKIDINFVNQNKITYSYNNLNNNVLKKIHNFLNTSYTNFLYRNFITHKNYWKLESSDSRDELDKYKYIKPTNNFTISKKNMIMLVKIGSEAMAIIHQIDFPH